MAKNKEELILDAATDLFSRYGLAKTTVDEIARAAGVGKGTVYLYFKTKEELFCAMVRRKEREIMRTVRAAVRKKKGVGAQLEAFFLTRYRLAKAFLADHQVPLDVLAETRPEVARTLQEFRHDQRTIVESILEAGVEAGEVVVEDLAMISLAITAMLDALDVPWIFEEGREVRLERKVEHLIDLVMHGLASRPR